MWWVAGGLAATTLGVAALVRGSTGIVEPGVPTSASELEEAYIEAVVPERVNRGFGADSLVTGRGMVQCDPVERAYEGLVVTCAEFTETSMFATPHRVTFLDDAGTFEVEEADDGSMEPVVGSLN